MKKRVTYAVKDKTVSREINYVPIRYIVAVFITILEIVAIISILIALCMYIPYFYLAALLTEIVCVVQIASSDNSPEYKAPWLLFVLLFPVVGFMLYFLFYSRKLQKKFIKRLEAIKKHGYKTDDKALDKLGEENRLIATHAKMLCDLADTHVFTDTTQEYFPLGEKAFEKMLEDLSSAEKFIYMEYFIIEEGRFWNSILEILKEKASSGADVKVLYDDIGCMMTLPGDYYKTLNKFGIQATPFARMKGNADSEFNNRSHRKILVIDGKIGYTGGINIADEYINEKVKYGHWKDSAIRLDGSAVWELTKLFLVDFGINLKDFSYPEYQPYPPRTDAKKDGYVIPFGDGPNPIYDKRVGKSVIQNMLNSATDYMYMTTPYLIIDNDLCHTIENTALRGVDVRLILPHIPDKKLVFGVTRSYYPRLLKAGVKIYEYLPGFVHAKNYLADDVLAMTGTINLDYRSLVHHFENGVWMYKCNAIKTIKDDFTATFEKCTKLTLDTVNPSLIQRAVTAIARIFAPML